MSDHYLAMRPSGVVKLCCEY